LRALPATRPPVAVESAPAPTDPDPITVTVSIGAADPGRRDRVLAALRQLITAAGTDIAVTGAVPDPSAEAAASASGAEAAGSAWGAPAAASVSGAPAAASVSGAPAAAGAWVPVSEPRTGLRLHPRPRTAALDGSPLELSRLEYDLLLFLARHPGQVFSRNQLLAQVWGHTHTGARTVDVHVSRLRTKLGDADVIATVYGLGYRLADHAAVTVVDR
jgi:hypothetical protein